MGLAFYLTFFASAGGAGTAMQMAAIAVMAAAAVYALIMRRFEAAPLSFAEIVFCVLGISYVILGVFGEDNAVFLAMAFLTTVIAISIVSRSIALESLLDTCGRVALAGILTIVVVNHADAAAALSSGIHGGGRAGIVRFMPLGLHPDLTGFVFGACAWMMARRVLVASLLVERLAMAGGTLASCLFVIAASSRSALIALAVSTCVAVFIEYGFWRLLSLTWVRIAGALAVMVGLAFASKITGFITTMLELDSSARGVSSGGTGRTELWARGISTFFQDPLVFMVGGGFRSSSADLIGFQTENSYISILLDSGVFLGGAVIMVFLYAPLKSLKIVPSAERYASRSILLASLMTYVIVESVFNRYLLAIGNPASLMSLVLLLALSVKPNAAKSASPIPSVWTPAHPTST